MTPNAPADLVFQDAPIPMFLFDPESLAILEANTAAERVYGFSRDEFKSLTLRDIRPPEEQAYLTAQLASAPHGNMAIRPSRHWTRDGRVLDVEITTQAIQYAGRAARLVLVLDRTELRKTADALRISDERYALAARLTRNAIWEWHAVTDRVTWSDGLTTVFGYELGQGEDAADWWIAHVHPSDRERVSRSVGALSDPGNREANWQESYRFLCADDKWAEVLDRAFVMRDDAGRVIRLIGAIEDVTAQRELEERLRQAQKMEAVGQLAGGIAHDFNNLLTVLTGSIEFIQAETPVDHSTHVDLEQMVVATKRARSLVRQLLTFSRKQAVQPRVIQVADVVGGMERMLRRLIGEEIALDVVVESVKPPVLIDPGQLEQVIMNLVLNARDALLTARHGHVGKGGALAIEVSAQNVSATPPARWQGVAPGRYVELVVRDSGHGMDDETRAKLFEPFFTTKPVGEGTGLGLATVHGIVRQANGAVHVESAPGAGAVFRVLLPAADPLPRHPAEVSGTADGEPLSSATILVVEDEAPVRAIIRRMLERRGYTIIEARHGADALILWASEYERIDAVLTDLRMPELGGRELVDQLHLERPTLPVVFVSGYEKDSSIDRLGPYDRFVEKPFTAENLVAALNDVLTRPQPQNG